MFIIGQNIEVYDFYMRLIFMYVIGQNIEVYDFYMFLFKFIQIFK